MTAADVRWFLASHPNNFTTEAGQLFRNLKIWQMVGFSGLCDIGGWAINEGVLLWRDDAEVVTTAELFRSIGFINIIQSDGNVARALKKVLLFCNGRNRSATIITDDNQVVSLYARHG